MQIRRADPWITIVAKGRASIQFGQIIDQEVRSTLRDIAVWSQKLADPNWSEQIAADLLPTEVNGANSKLEQAEQAGSREA